MPNKFAKWLLVSSANPEKISLMVRGALLGLIPVVLKVASLACGFHVCANLDQTSLEHFVGVLADLAFWAFSIVAGVQAAYGFVRKVYLTLLGKNQAL